MLRPKGVSNVSIEYFEELFKVATIIPAVNQVELHPYVPPHTTYPTRN
jgi:glycerol 2-dehydrogenase (NADP+)